MTTAYTRQTKALTARVKENVQRQFAATVAPDLDPDMLSAYAAALGATVEAGQLVIGNMTSAHLSNEFHLPVAPTVDPAITQRDTGIAKEDLYQRPYRVVAQEVRGGASIDEAVAAGSRRLGNLTGVDLQMAKVRQAQQVLRVAHRNTYRRQTTSEKPCDLCQIASTQVYYTDDLLPIHDGCSCEITADDTNGDQDEADQDFELPPGKEQVKAINELIENGAEPSDYRDLIEIRQHGEVGPMLTWRGQHFTGPDDLPNPAVVLDAKGRVLQRRGRPLTLEEVNQRNAADRAQYRRRAAERRAIRGEPEPRYASAIEASRVEAEAMVERSETLATERIARLKVAPTPWSDAEYALEDNPKLPREQQIEARRLAEELYRAGAAIEPVITAATQASVQQLGGYMSGLDFRLKTGPSMYRKIQADALENKISVGKAAAGIKDSVRYTGIMDEEGYWKSGDELRRTLESLGAKTIKDPIGIPLEGYRGRNMAFEFHGTPFELQVNTELGVAIKEENHELYNIWRLIEDKESPEAVELYNRMQTSWDAIPITRGTPVVPTYKDVQQPAKILYVAKDSKYRGPTLPGGEQEFGAPDIVRRERVPASQYGMDYFPGRGEIVARARELDESAWEALPVEYLPHGTPIHANEATLKKRSIDKVVKGSEPFREGYVTKLWRDKKGELHVVDGHHRVAMYNALGKDMPVRIMDEATYLRLKEAETLEAQRLERLANQPPTPWSDAEYAAEDNADLPVDQQIEARRLAEELYRDGADIEPVITKATVESVEQLGGFMSGLDFKLKTGPSMYRKIQADALEKKISVGEAAAKIKDSVRYTAVMDPEGYWASGNELRRTLESLGAEVIKDPIGLPLEGYRGRNMAFKFHGTYFELQVHTELGVALKEENHELYNIWREIKNSEDPKVKAYADELRQRMQTSWDAIPIMDGTPIVPTDRDVQDIEKILYVARDSKYRGPTVPGGEAEIGGQDMLKRERVPSSQYGMDYVPGRAKIVAPARGVPESLWDTMPVETVPYGTPIHANEASLKKSSIDKVVNGSEPFRTGYVAKLWRDAKGELHVVDGHHRVAMHHALGLDMQAHIMDQATYEAMVARAGGPEAMSAMMAEQEAVEAAKKAAKEAAKK